MTISVKPPQGHDNSPYFSSFLHPITLILPTFDIKVLSLIFDTHFFFLYKHFYEIINLSNLSFI